MQKYSVVKQKSNQLFLCLLQNIHGFCLESIHRLHFSWEIDLIKLRMKSISGYDKLFKSFAFNLVR